MKYRIFFSTTASTAIEVEADSFDDALDKAYEGEFPDICAQCSGWGQEANLELGDWWDADEKFYYVDGKPVRVPGEDS